MIGAKWEEIDLKSRVWNVPADRMKKFKDHTVPLSPRSIAILEAMPRNGAYVFMSADGKKRIGSSTMRKLLKKTAPAYSVHGFVRASAIGLEIAPGLTARRSNTPWPIIFPTRLRLRIVAAPHWTSGAG